MPAFIFPLFSLLYVCEFVTDFFHSHSISSFRRLFMFNYFFKKHALSIAKILLCPLIIIYPLFMNFLSGLGFFIVQNSDGFSFNFLKYSRFLSFCGLSLIFGGLLIVFSYITCLKKHFVFSIISDCLGFLISMLALFFICRHADSAGWFNNAYNSSFSHLLFLRIFPSVIPFIICLALSVIQLFGSVNSPRSTKNH